MRHFADASFLSEDDTDAWNTIQQLLLAFLNSWVTKSRWSSPLFACHVLCSCHISLSILLGSRATPGSWVPLLYEDDNTRFKSASEVSFHSNQNLRSPTRNKYRNSHSRHHPYPHSAPPQFLFTSSFTESSFSLTTFRIMNASKSIETRFHDLFPPPSNMSEIIVGWRNAKAKWWQMRRRPTHWSITWNEIQEEAPGFPRSQPLHRRR